MVRSKRASSSPISIGDCLVEVAGNGLKIIEATGKTLRISSSDGSKIKISVDDSRKHNNLPSSLKSHDDVAGTSLPLETYMFVLVSPKDVDSHTKLLCQEILKIYMQELPTMNYAANTGKESLFLERCISSGKYKTLILKSNSTEGLGELVAAVSYQIIPSDTQYAEIPLAAVGSKFQSKGFGHLLYRELRKRLQSVGIVTIFCWADEESKGFWLKQGFIAIGEVDSKGKTRRLPIKADIRRTLCFPGGSTLMVAHLNRDSATSVNSSMHFTLCSANCPDNPLADVFTRTVLSENRTDKSPKNTSPNEHVISTSCRQIKNTQTQESMEIKSSKDGACPCTISLPCFTNKDSSNNPSYSNAGDDLAVMENEYATDSTHRSSKQRVNKRVWEASLSSLKSKRIRGGLLVEHCQNMKHDFTCNHVTGNDSVLNDCTIDTPGCEVSLDVNKKVPVGHTSAIHSEEKSSYHIGDGVVLRRDGPRIMLMDIDNDVKKKCLAKIVEGLGGSITWSGSSCTHVITGKIRRTSNFCTALCSGAWIVSPKWLKASFREGKFLGESQFLLEDEEYMLKYKSELRHAVMRAKKNPNALLSGYDVCLAKHIQPSVDILSSIVKSAGGNVIRRLGSTQQEPWRSIFVACEEDMEEAMAAARDGVWTYSSDWLVGCIMKQELDFEAPQFAESLSQ